MKIKHFKCWRVWDNLLYSGAYNEKGLYFFLSKRRWNKEALIIIANNKHFLLTIYMIIPVKAYQRIHHFKACCALFRFGRKEKIIWSNWVIQQSYFSFTLKIAFKNAPKSSILTHAIVAQVGWFGCSVSIENTNPQYRYFQSGCSKECRFRIVKRFY